MTIREIILSAQASGHSPRFCKWLEFVLEWECVFDRNGEIVAENVPGDHGGLTFAGIDIASHPGFDFDNPRSEYVVDIYKRCYWDRVHAEQLHWPIGEVVANFGVNMGLRPAIKMLQTAINILPGKGATVVDGLIGPKTIAAAETEDSERLADLIEDEADERYRGIVRARPSQMKFLQGWLNRDNALERWWMSLK